MNKLIRILCIISMVVLAPFVPIMLFLLSHCMSGTGPDLLSGWLLVIGYFSLLLSCFITLFNPKMVYINSVTLAILIIGVLVDIKVFPWQ